MKATITNVIIDRAEGTSDLCGEQTFPCIELAQAFLQSRSETYPKRGGYDKHDVTIHFSDGETMQIRMDCQHPSCNHPDLDILQHIQTFLKFYAGLYRPAHLTEEQYQRAIAGHQDDYLAFLAQHDVGI